MNVSIIEPSPNCQDAGATGEVEDKYWSNVPLPSAPKTPESMAFSKNRTLESAHKARMGPPTVSPDSAATSLSPIPLHIVAETPNLSPTARPKSRPASRDTSPYPRSRPSTPNRPSTPASSIASSSARQLPPRRSARTLAKGSDRPRGPPELEAALTIAIRNLESDIYEWWCANQKPGDPIPTTAYLKGRSPRIRRAAEAVDEADRLLNEAIYGKPRKGKPIARKSQERLESQASATPGEISDIAFGQLKLNSQSNLPSPPSKAEGVSSQSAGGKPPRQSTREKDSTRSGG